MWGIEVASWASTRIFPVTGFVRTPAFSKFRLEVSGTRPEGHRARWKVSIRFWVYLKPFSERPLRIGKTSSTDSAKGLKHVHTHARARTPARTCTRAHMQTHTCCTSTLCVHMHTRSVCTRCLCTRAHMHVCAHTHICTENDSARTGGSGADVQSGMRNPQHSV